MKATKKPASKTLGTKDREPAVSIVDDDETPSAPTTDSGTEIVEDLDESLGAAPVAAPTAAIMEADSLEVVFLDAMYDYPIIGRYNFQEVHGVSVIRKHQKFIVPRDVALTLYDKKLVTIPSMLG